jgi:MFS family permease
MSFKLFIYYCALSGGWAALVAWALASVLGLTRDDVGDYASTTLTAGLLGVLLAAVIGLLDALLNSVGAQRILRVLVALSVGLVGGLLAGLVGEGLHQGLYIPRFFGWMLVGLAIGASIGVFDLIKAKAAGQPAHMARRKIVNGVIGGVLGGLVGGVLFELLIGSLDLPRSSLAIGLVVLGLCIGLLIGLAQIILKEAWLRVEAGFRPGRELIVSKQETTIGRAESCDIGLFGDPSIEKIHARVLNQGNRYLVADAGTPTGTFLNDHRVAQPTPLRSGDAIRVGNSIIRFGERQKRR